MSNLNVEYWVTEIEKARPRCNAFESGLLNIDSQLNYSMNARVNCEASLPCVRFSCIGAEKTYNFPFTHLFNLKYKKK